MTGRRPDLAPTIVTAPHCGSRSSPSERLVESTRPDWVVYQAGYRNRFGHPAGEVVARYAASGARAVRTDHAGGTQWRPRGDGSVAVESMRTHRARYWHNRPGTATPEANASEDLPSYRSEPATEPLQPYRSKCLASFLLDWFGGSTGAGCGNGQGV